jgi:hypothetical protein
MLHKLKTLDCLSRPTNFNQPPPSSLKNSLNLFTRKLAVISFAQKDARSQEQTTKKLISHDQEVAIVTCGGCRTECCGLANHDDALKPQTSQNDRCFYFAQLLLIND